MKMKMIELAMMNIMLAVSLTACDTQDNDDRPTMYIDSTDKYSEEAISEANTAATLGEIESAEIAMNNDLKTLSGNEIFLVKYEGDSESASAIYYIYNGTVYSVEYNDDATYNVGLYAKSADSWSSTISKPKDTIQESDYSDLVLDSTACAIKAIIPKLNNISITEINDISYIGNSVDGTVVSIDYANHRIFNISCKSSGSAEINYEIYYLGDDSFENLFTQFKRELEDVGNELSKQILQRLATRMSSYVAPSDSAVDGESIAESESVYTPVVDLPEPTKSTEAPLKPVVYEEITMPNGMYAEPASWYMKDSRAAYTINEAVSEMESAIGSTVGDSILVKTQYGEPLPERTFAPGEVLEMVVYTIINTSSNENKTVYLYEKLKNNSERSCYFIELTVNDVIIP